jgi:uncharacterized protein YbbK (DUF523 family)
MTVNIVKRQETFKSNTKETVIVSLCAFGAQCRYHGKSHKMGQFLYKETPTEQLRNKYIVLPLCGEIMGGLPTPREPCDVVETPEGLRVIGRNNSKDYTVEYNKGAQEALRLAKIFKVKKAYLLKDSPMCGKGYGILARMLEENGIQVNHI